MISQNCSVIFCCELLFLPEQLREMGGSRHIKTVQNHLEHKDTDTVKLSAQVSQQLD